MDFDEATLATSDLGSLYGQYLLSSAFLHFALPVCEKFYADKAAQRKLKEANYDLLLGDTGVIVNRYAPFCGQFGS